MMSDERYVHPASCFVKLISFGKKESIYEYKVLRLTKTIS